MKTVLFTTQNPMGICFDTTDVNITDATTLDEAIERVINLPLDEEDPSSEDVKKFNTQLSSRNYTVTEDDEYIEVSVPMFI